MPTNTQRTEPTAEHARARGGVELPPLRGVVGVAACVLWVAVVLGLAPNAGAQTPPDYSWQWATITNPGNRPINQTEGRFMYPPFDISGRQYGQVNHVYRMAKTEVTNAQWYEFVRAYAPYWSGPAADISFSSRFIGARTSRPTTADDWILPAGSENFAAQGMSWIYAARFVNWLHNGKQTDRASFEHGVYDVPSPQYDGMGPSRGFIPAPITRNAGAQFWIPSSDEWRKAVYYDPNRYGPGIEGYWQYTDSTNNNPIQGWPWQGGQTDANMPSEPNGQFRILDVGSYPNVITPWGLLDANSSASEMTDDMGIAGGTVTNPVYAVAYLGMARFGGYSASFGGRIDFAEGANFDLVYGGLRLASAVPSPPVMLIAIGFGLSARRRMIKG